MLKISKLSIGVRTARNMFRISALGGLIADSLLALPSKKNKEQKWFDKISTNFEQGVIQIKDRDEYTHLIRIERSNIIYVYDSYQSEDSVNSDQMLNDFEVIWNSINEIVGIKDVRRIGIVGEYQLSTGKKHSSTSLLETLTLLPKVAHPAKFHLRYENRLPTKEGIAPDILKSDFINIIHEYYDSEIDVEHSKEGSINANLDVQRYFSPLIHSNIPNEAQKLFKFYKNSQEELENMLKAKGLVLNG